MKRAVVVTCLLLVGCHSAPPRGDLYPAFYMSRSRLSQDMRASLDHHRDAVLASPQEPELLLAYARRVALLANQEVDSWLAAQHNSERVVPSTSLLQSESRMLQSCRHALALFHEADLNGGAAGWQDRVAVAWFSILTGNEGRAELILGDLTVDPRVPDHAVSAMRGLLDCLPHLPENR
ncbi:MAG: hypothetical protein AAF581_11365 [Planctomycetota bacterium]